MVWWKGLKNLVKEEDRDREAIKAIGREVNTLNAIENTNTMDVEEEPKTYKIENYSKRNLVKQLSIL